MENTRASLNRPHPVRCLILSAVLDEVCANTAEAAATATIATRPWRNHEEPVTVNPSTSLFVGRFSLGATREILD